MTGPPPKKKRWGLLLLLHRGADGRCTTLEREESRRLCENIVNRQDDAIVAALQEEGWLCRFGVILGTQRKAKGVDVAWHDAVDAACGITNVTLKGQRGRRKRAVISVQHNGLGNQIFQFAAARLLALAEDGPFGARAIESHEGAMDSKLPPHSVESWAAFQDIFGVDTNTAESKCARSMVPRQGHYDVNGTVLLGQRPADGRRVKFPTLVSRVFSAETTCVKALGYFQDYALLRGAGETLRSNLLRAPSANERPLTEEPSSDDVVIHVRLCNGPYHFYRYYDVPNYFRPILHEMSDSDEFPPIKIITGCDPKQPGVVRDLIETFHAQVAHPALSNQGSHHRSIAADFLYLTRATTLIVTESTFGFWAAFLNRVAHTIHAPADGSVPVPYLEPNYVFHDIHRSAFWGVFHNDSNSIVFPIRGTDLSSSGQHLIGGGGGGSSSSSSSSKKSKRKSRRSSDDSTPPR